MSERPLRSVAFVFGGPSPGRATSGPRRLFLFRFLFMFIAAFFWTSASFAHELCPTVLTITALGQERYEVVIVKAPEAQKIQFVFPDGCVKEKAPFDSDLRFVLACEPFGFAQHRIDVIGLSPVRDEVLVRFYEGGTLRTSAIATAARPFVATVDFSQPEVPRAAQAAFASYFLLGVQHFMTGADHIFFLVGLLLLLSHGAAGSFSAVRRAAITMTAFTVAHSITLSCSLFGAISLRPAPVEAAIALSVVFVGAHVLSVERRQTKLNQQKCWLLAFGFGLLHGLGFASGLRSLLISTSEIGMALVGFNVGLECAQLAVIVVFFMGLRRYLFSMFRSAIAYGMGTLGTFWTIQRVLTFWSS